MGEPNPERGPARVAWRTPSLILVAGALHGYEDTLPGPPVLTGVSCAPRLTEPFPVSCGDRAALIDERSDLARYRAALPESPSRWTAGRRPP